MKTAKLIGLFLLTGILMAFVWQRGFGQGQNQTVAAPQAAVPQGNSFTYQGLLERGGQPLTAECDMAFTLYDAQLSGTMVGTTINQTVPVTNSLFTAELDFGGTAFAGSERWLEVGVQCPSDSSVTYLPRQRISAAPYALYALNSDKLDNLDSSNFARVARFGLPGGVTSSVDIPIPRYTSFQIMISEAYGSPDQVTWLMGVENDYDIAYILIDPDGTVTSGTAALNSTTTLLTITQGAGLITLKTPGTNEARLVLSTQYLDVRATLIY
jgi:hypothetical protein